MDGNHVQKPAPDLNDANGKEILRFRIDTVSDVVEAVALKFVWHRINPLAMAAQMTRGFVA